MALNASDKYRFNHPPILSGEEWQVLVNKTLTEADSFVSLIKQLPVSKYQETFSDEKYGNYYRNIHGIIEHTHYHLGQIVLIKKIILEKEKTDAGF